MDIGDTGFDWADLVDEAVSRSGGETSTAADILKVRRSFRILSERWMAKGYNTWRLTSKRFLVMGVTTSINLPDCVDDIIQVNSRINGTTESNMSRITANQYAQLTSKETKGQPSQWYLRRGNDCPELFLYPIGSATATTEVFVYYVERPAAFERYDPMDDIPGRWLEALVTGLALDLARKRPPYDEALINRLKGEASEAEEIAQRADRERVNFRVRIG